MPVCRAACHFSQKPPGPPPSLVTRVSMANWRISATLSWVEKGPCMAMMWPLGKPKAAAFSTAWPMGSIRG